MNRDRESEQAASAERRRRGVMAESGEEPCGGWGEGGESAKRKAFFLGLKKDNYIEIYYRGFFGWFYVFEICICLSQLRILWSKLGLCSVVFAFRFFWSSYWYIVAFFYFCFLSKFMLMFELLKNSQQQNKTADLQPQTNMQFYSRHKTSAANRFRSLL